jgi:hypothetical protein
MFSVEDMFAFGIVCDIAGGYLVARGLLASAPKLARRTASFWNSSPPAVIGQTEDRIAGLFGTASLVFGFVIQAAYTLVAGGAELPSPTTGQALLVAASAALPAVGVLLAEKVFRGRLRRSFLIKVARYEVNEMAMMDLPSAKALFVLGHELGQPRVDGESDESYTRRVWRVDAVRE